MQRLILSKLLLVLLSFYAWPVLAADIDQAPKGFASGAGNAVPVDFQSVLLDLNFDPATQAATGRCEIEFTANQTGYPIFDLVPVTTQVLLNGNDLGADGAPVVNAPSNATKVRVVKASVNAGSRNTLVVEYKMDTTQVAFSGSGIRLLWAMSDLGADRRFLEKYACGNLEFDRFPMRLRLNIAGSPDKHQIFTNGSLQLIRPGSYLVEFPDYFTSSSHFLHVTNKLFAVASDDYKGIEKNIPITVYGTSQSAVDKALVRSKTTLTELEGTYGPYAHETLTVYLNEFFGGGMEHVGATITSMGALEHEITHSWFARGVMPANGNAGWIDEAIASWRDDGYPRKAATLTASAANLGAFAEYRRSTTESAYSYGADLMARFDSLFSSGLKPVLKEFFASTKYLAITTPDFETILERITGTDVSDHFKRYVYNGSVVATTWDLLPTLPIGTRSKHPRPLTQREIERLR